MKRKNIRPILGSLMALSLVLAYSAPAVAKGKTVVSQEEPQYGGTLTIAHTGWWIANWDPFGTSGPASRQWMYESLLY